MPRELITIQVGQCGNQVGRRFWEMALAEHCQNSPSASVFDEPMSSFFHNKDTRYHDVIGGVAAAGGQHQQTHSLKARAVLVDMEEGPVSETFRGPLGDLFDRTQLITDVSGAGNNFAHGHYAYGSKYGESILEAVRNAAELCGSLQSFFLMHSLGGGTGSGLGTYILGLLEDHFPHTYRFTTSVFPSEDDDVVTSPYNSVLALQQLTNHADCVLPVENKSLMEFVEKGENDNSRNKADQLPSLTCKASSKGTAAAAAGAGNGTIGTGFDDMNGILARVLMDLTASMRFAGDLNVDLNEITTNLVPYPRMRYLMSSLSHLGPNEKAGRTVKASQQLKQVCTGAFARRNQLMRADPRSGTMLACALLFRGKDISLSDVTTNVNRLQSEMRMIPWNREGFKIGLCSTPALNQPPDYPSLLSLSNNCCIASTFIGIEKRFNKLFCRRAMLHHYTQYVEVESFEEARSDLAQLIEDYQGLDRPKPIIPRSSHSTAAAGLPLRMSPLF